MLANPVAALVTIAAEITKTSVMWCFAEAGDQCCGNAGVQHLYTLHKLLDTVSLGFSSFAGLTAGAPSLLQKPFVHVCWNDFGQQKADQVSHPGAFAAAHEAVFQSVEEALQEVVGLTLQMR